MNEDPPSGGGAGKSPYGPGVELLEEFQRSLAAADIALVVAWLKGPMLIRFKTTGLTALIEDRNFYCSVRHTATACAAGQDPGWSS